VALRLQSSGRFLIQGRRHEEKVTDDYVRCFRLRGNRRGAVVDVAGAAAGIELSSGSERATSGAWGSADVNVKYRESRDRPDARLHSAQCIDCNRDTWRHRHSGFPCEW
jgi:hypothetical protein